MEQVQLYGRIYAIPHEVETDGGDNRKAIAAWVEALSTELEREALLAGIPQQEVTIGEGPAEKTLNVWITLPPELHDRVAAARAERAKAATPAPASPPNDESET